MKSELKNVEKTSKSHEKIKMVCAGEDSSQSSRRAADHRAMPGAV